MGIIKSFELYLFQSQKRRAESTRTKGGCWWDNKWKKKKKLTRKKKEKKSLPLYHSKLSKGFPISIDEELTSDEHNRRLPVEPGSVSSFLQDWQPNKRTKPTPDYRGHNSCQVTYSHPILIIFLKFTVNLNIICATKFFKNYNTYTIRLFYKLTWYKKICDTKLTYKFKIDKKIIYFYLVFLY